MSTFRLIQLSIFIICAVLIGIALYFQYVLYLDPCPLCMVQRVTVMAIGALCLVGFLQNPGAFGRKVYAALLIVISLFGAGIAGRHVYLQNLPADQVPECFPGIEFILQTNPLIDALSIILSGTGECAETLWTFLGISIPGWTLFAFCAFFAAAVFIVAAERRRPSVEV